LISIYADGSSDGSSSGAIGWAYILVENGLIIATGSGGAPIGTNNIAELTACIEGLKAVIDRKDVEVELVSDSQYALGMASGQFTPNKNLELAAEIKQLFKIARAKSRWVRGHNGDLLNEIADKLAKRAKEQYSGPKTTKRDKRRLRKMKIRSLL